MKPTVPESGVVISTDKGMAQILLQGGEACKGCGQAKMGLCKASELSMIIIARNTLNATVGDRVIVGIDETVKLKGYLLAFIVPLLSLLAGAILGHLAGRLFNIPDFEVISGFSGLIAGSVISLKQLKRLDSKSSLVIKSLFKSDWNDLR